MKTSQLTDPSGHNLVVLPSRSDGYFLRDDGVWATAGGGGAPSGSASGDLSANYPNPTVAKIQGRAVASTEPTDGYILTWVAGSSDWEPKPLSGGVSPNYWYINTTRVNATNSGLQTVWSASGFPNNSVVDVEVKLLAQDSSTATKSVSVSLGITATVNDSGVVTLISPTSEARPMKSPAVNGSTTWAISVSGNSTIIVQFNPAESVTYRVLCTATVTINTNSA